MWKWVVIVLAASLVVGGVMYIRTYPSTPTLSPLGKLIEKPLEQYTIERLSLREFTGSQIVMDEAVATTSAYKSDIFHFSSDGPTSSLDNRSGLRGVKKKVTGLAHIPVGKGPFPVIVQFRGYANRETYVSGEGTRRSAEVFARNGFISLAPDFLGYGGSDMPGDDVFEERFSSYVVALNLLASIPTLAIADDTTVRLWGHSNGGQVAITVLEILGDRGATYPTSLWAPVTKPFPYSILYYTDDFDDHGKMLRKRLSEFENTYDAEAYSLTNYIDRIAAPIQIHQGGADDAVPVAWSDDFVKLMKGKKKDLPAGEAGITYYTYPGADHNMQPAWGTVVARDVEFFR